MREDNLFSTTLRYIINVARDNIREDGLCDSLTKKDIRDHVNEALNSSERNRRKHGAVIKMERERLLVEACRYLESEFSISVTESSFLVADGTVNWLTNQRESEIVNNVNGFWCRYEQKLRKSWSWSTIAVDKLNKETSKILGFLGDPGTSAFQIKGLVIGDVQSGKTANYAGLINKAADAGYQLIIVIAGVLSSLRTQTQLRMEADFSGRITYQRGNREIISNVRDYGRVGKEPMGLTDCENSFDRRSIGRQLPSFKDGEIAFAVINKNAAILGNIIRYLKGVSPQEREKVSVLVIDDEADNASVNSNPTDVTPTKINKKIRELLALFKKVSYVGYTATPFANIFINPEISGSAERSVEKAMEGQDLFPRDFIYCLGTPSNYMGATKLFCRDEDDSSPVVRSIPEEREFIKTLESQGDPELPKSLIRAVYTFVLARAIRNIRGDISEHCSMLIHISLKRGVHSLLQPKVDVILQELLRAIKAYISLPYPENKDDKLALLKKVWQGQYENAGIPESWEGVCQAMRSESFLEQFKVYKLNSDSRTANDSGEEVDYSSGPGQSPIIIGGNRLSRGLTFEGLTVTYFLRQSKQYDTLMQMGRWFGYRNGYEDICRVFLPRLLQLYFAEIAEATEELKASIDDMHHWDMRPLEFGLRVRNSVEGLRVTAANKMRNTAEYYGSLDFTNSHLASCRVPSSPEKIEANAAALRKFIKKIDERYKRREDREDEVKVGIIWNDVSADDIIGYLNECEGMVTSRLYDFQCLSDYIKMVGTLDVAFINKNMDKKQSAQGAPIRILPDLPEQFVPMRVPQSEKNGYISFKKSRVFSRHHEMGYQNKQRVDEWCQEFAKTSKKKTVTYSDLPARYYRQAEGRKDLMLLSFIWIPDKDFIDKEVQGDLSGEGVGKEHSKPSSDDLKRCVAVYGFSFSNRQDRKFKNVRYVCNEVIRKRLLLEEEDGDDEEDEY